MLRRRLTALAGLAGVIALGACASQPATPETSVNAGLAQFEGDAAPDNLSSGPTAPSAQGAPQGGPANADELAAIFQRDAELLPTLSDTATPDRTDSTWRDNPDRFAEGPREPSGRPSFLDDPSVPPASGAAPGANARMTADELRRARTRSEERSRLVAELSSLLRTEARLSSDPFLDYLALAALEAIEPGALSGPGSIDDLSPREADQLTALRDMARAIGLRFSDASSEDRIEALALAVNEAARRINQWRSLSVQEVQLCSRVDGYGVYNPLDSTRMVAGRRHRAIVYVELDNFATRPDSGPSGEAGFRVELAQELQLFNEADGLLVWRTAQQPVNDFSRNRRREFYTVQIIELPDNLSVGRYQLKVLLRDRNTDAIAEAFIPIELVADPALTRVPD